VERGTRLRYILSLNRARVPTIRSAANFHFITPRMHSALWHRYRYRDLEQRCSFSTFARSEAVSRCDSEFPAFGNVRRPRNEFDCRRACDLLRIADARLSPRRVAAGRRDASKIVRWKSHSAHRFDYSETIAGISTVLRGGNKSGRETRLQDLSPAKILEASRENAAGAAKPHARWQFA